MNISIVTTFTIGTLFFLSILALNRNMMVYSAESTVELMSQYQHEELFDMITHDLSRIGYGFPTGSSTVEIKQLKDNEITFTADVLENGVNEINWNFTGNSASATKNPHDKILRRTGTMGSGTPSNQQRDYYVVDFKITAYSDTYGQAETTIPDQVESLMVEIAYESAFPTNMRYNGLKEYERKYWRKLIVPKNLQF